MLRRPNWWYLLLCLTTMTPATVDAGPIDTMLPGTWYEIPNSKLSSVFPNPAPPGSPTAVIQAWSSGAYDTQRDRLIIWGGGHSDYSGNEIYAFSLATMTWSRLTNPTMDVSGTESSGYYPDGKPRSRHTYDYLEYLGPPFDRLCSFGGSGLYPSGQITVRNTDCFNFASSTWSRYADCPAAGIGICSAYDPVKKHAWVHGPNSNGQLTEYDPVANTWTARGVAGPGDVYYTNGEIDPVRRRYIAIGNNVAASWNIDAVGTLPRTNLATTGATAIQAVSNPGLAYDPVSDKLVAWSGGTDVYTLNLNTLVWTKVPAAASNTVTPSAPDPRGTYGRFRYVPSKNAFIVVNGTDTNVFVYKLSAGGGAPADSVSPGPISTLIAH